MKMMVAVLVPLECGGTRPRGVRVELATFYNPNQDFSCLGRSLNKHTLEIPELLLYL